MECSDVLLTEGICQGTQLGLLQQCPGQARGAGRARVEGSSSFLQPRVTMVGEAGYCMADGFKIMTVTGGANGVVILAQRPRLIDLQGHFTEDAVQVDGILLSIVAPAGGSDTVQEFRPARGSHGMIRQTEEQAVGSTKLGTSH